MNTSEDQGRDWQTYADMVAERGKGGSRGAPFSQQSNLFPRRKGNAQRTWPYQAAEHHIGSNGTLSNLSGIKDEKIWTEKGIFQIYTDANVEIRHVL
jgi:hypothetical protein